MLIVFKSQATGDVMMFEKNARELLAVLGKDRNAAQGVITLEQLPDAIQRLRDAIDADKATRADVDSGEPDPVDQGTGQPRIHLAQRAVPLLEMLQFALDGEKPVTWGV
ncbi:MAG: DUF1840 domain-containing protein [Rhodocyclaceae bacterium]|nr:DUF1840 domain-containing protein [Rhodocyclaceae bacterium]